MENSNKKRKILKKKKKKKKKKMYPLMGINIKRENLK
jgi:hypothetical protein